jgi:hypothetical protein
MTDVYRVDQAHLPPRAHHDGNVRLSADLRCWDWGVRNQLLIDQERTMDGLDVIGPVLTWRVQWQVSDQVIRDTASAGQ